MTDTTPYRHRHPETFASPTTTDPVQACKVAQEQREAAHRRVKGCLAALVAHDGRGQLLAEEWALAVSELDQARAHEAETLARWADEVIPCDPKGPTP